MRRLAALISALCLVALAASCGSSASAQEIVTQAADATIAESTAKVALNMEITGAEFPSGKLVITADGVIDFAAKRVAMILDFGDSLADVGVGAGDSTVEMVTAGTTIYMRSPLFSQGGGFGPDQWLKFDFAELSKTEGLDLGQLQQAGNNDPRQGLAFLDGAAEDGVEKLGSEEIRGVDTTHYRAEIDLEKAVKEAGGVTDPEAFRRFVDSLGTKTIVVDTWIDSENRVRRVSLPLPLPPEAEGEAKMSMDYFAFGTDVDVTVPPEADVVDVGAMLSGG